MMEFVGLCDFCRSSGVPTTVARGSRAVCGDCYVACRHEEGRPA